jgi:hypothetical protein
MMPINASIPLGVQPMQLPMPDPNQGMNALARAMQIQGAMSQNELAKYSLGRAQRQDQESNAIADLVRGGIDPMTPEGQAKLYGAAPLSAEGFLKGRLETKNLQSQIGERDSKAKNEAFQRAKQGYGVFQQVVGAHFNNPNATPQYVANSVQGLVQAGLLEPTVGERLVASIPQDPTQFRSFLNDVLKAQMTPEQLLTAFAPKPTEVDNGQQKVFRDTNPNSPTYGQVTAGAPVQKVATPGEVLSAETSRRGQNMVDARSREANAQGRVPAGYRQKPDGSLEFIPGGPADDRSD